MLGTSIIPRSPPLCARQVNSAITPRKLPVTANPPIKPPTIAIGSEHRPIIIGNAGKIWGDRTVTIPLPKTNPTERTELLMTSKFFESFARFLDKRPHQSGSFTIVPCRSAKNRCGQYSFLYACQVLKSLQLDFTVELSLAARYGRKLAANSEISLLDRSNFQVTILS
jgi:hypothetical protein